MKDSQRNFERLVNRWHGRILKESCLGPSRRSARSIRVWRTCFYLCGLLRLSTLSSTFLYHSTIINLTFSSLGDPSHSAPKWYPPKLKPPANLRSMYHSLHMTSAVPPVSPITSGGEMAGGGISSVKLSIWSSV